MSALKAIGRWLSGKRPPTFEAFQSPADLKWRVHKIGGNGEIEDVSQPYAEHAKDRGRAGARAAAIRKAAQIPGAKWRVKNPA